MLHVVRQATYMQLSMLWTMTCVGQPDSIYLTVYIRFNMLPACDWMPLNKAHTEQDFRCSKQLCQALLGLPAPCITHFLLHTLHASCCIQYTPHHPKGLCPSPHHTKEAPPLCPVSPPEGSSLTITDVMFACSLQDKYGFKSEEFHAGVSCLLLTVMLHQYT